ncbi:MAG TPA: PadR family transcriptional regulator [Dehalococcoidia bacterium]|nr:PadR family transcriptional regulator [Dehalococcoidia bacterium]
MPRRGHQIGSADHAILGLLAVAPRHGYELAASFAAGGELAPVCTLGLSQLYALLHALEELGYVYSSTSPVSGGPPRKVFHVAYPGAVLFQRWLERPVDRIRQVRTDFLLKLYFSQRLADHDTVALLDRQIAASRAYLVEVEAAAATEPPDSFEALVLSSRVNAAEATLAWLRRQRDRIAAAVERTDG